MQRKLTKRAKAYWISSYFIFGASFYLLYWRWYVHLTYSESPRDFVDAPLTNIAIFILGGGFVSFFMFRLLSKTLYELTFGVAGVMARSGLYGLVSTFLTFELVYVLSAAYLALSPLSPVHGTGFAQVFYGFIVLFMAIQTFGMVTIAACLPLSFLACSLLGIPLWRAWKLHSVKREGVA